jgi:hypothetical protein
MPRRLGSETTPTAPDKSQGPYTKAPPAGHRAEAPLPNLPQWLGAAASSRREVRALGSAIDAPNVLMRLNYYGFSVEKPRLSPENSPAGRRAEAPPAELSSPVSRGSPAANSETTLCGLALPVRSFSASKGVCARSPSVRAQPGRFGPISRHRNMRNFCCHQSALQEPIE